MRVLKLGKRGNDVTELQTHLTALGYDVKGIDGNFGKGTQSGVMLFQRDNNLKVDGLVGPNTRATILSKLKPLEYKTKWIDKQTLVITLPKPSMKVVKAKGKETVEKMFNRLPIKPKLFINGPIFHQSKTMGYLASGGNIELGVMSKHTIADNGKGMVHFPHYYFAERGILPVEAVGGGPTLVLGGKINIDKTGFDMALYNSLQPRIAMGIDDVGNLTIVIVHGRRLYLGHKGCTIPSLAEIMLKEGCTTAIALDGGGSIYAIDGHGKVLGKPLGKRPVVSGIAFY